MGGRVKTEIALLKSAISCSRKNVLIELIDKLRLVARGLQVQERSRKKTPLLLDDEE